MGKRSHGGRSVMRVRTGQAGVSTTDVRRGLAVGPHDRRGELGIRAGGASGAGGKHRAERIARITSVNTIWPGRVRVAGRACCSASACQMPSAPSATNRPVR